MRSMSSGASSQFFLPGFLRNGLNHCVASMSCTLPFRCAGFLLDSTQILGGDARVVEEVEGQSDDGFEPVVFDEPAADVALALACVPGKER